MKLFRVLNLARKLSKKEELEAELAQAIADRKSAQAKARALKQELTAVDGKIGPKGVKSSVEFGKV